jgi:hypothetical protein
LTGLKNSYAHERAAYIELKAQAHGQFHDPQVPRFVPSGTLLHGLAKGKLKMTNDQFRDLTYVEFMALETQLNKQAKVIFLSKLQRLRYLVAVEDGRFFRAVDGSPFNSSNHRVHFDLEGNGTEQCIYACDKHGNLFAMTGEESNYKDSQGGLVQINHSTLCAGADVLSAGSISIKDGYLKGLSNNSGHYAPTTNQLQVYLRVFNETFGVDLMTVIVFDKAIGIFTTAARFLRNDFSDQVNDPFVKGVLASTH